MLAPPLQEITTGLLQQNRPAAEVLRIRFVQELMSCSKNIAGGILSAPTSHIDVDGRRIELNLLSGIIHRGIVTGNKAKQPLKISRRFRVIIPPVIGRGAADRFTRGPRYEK